MTPPKVVYILIAKTCDCSVPLHWTVKVANGMEVANHLTSERGHLLGPGDGPSVIQRLFMAERKAEV